MAAGVRRLSDGGELDDGEALGTMTTIPGAEVARTARTGGAGGGASIAPAGTLLTSAPVHQSKAEVAGTAGITSSGDRGSTSALDVTHTTRGTP